MLVCQTLGCVDGLWISAALHRLFPFLYEKNGNIHRSELVYVDDLIVAGNDSATIRQCKAYLSSHEIFGSF